MIDDEIVALMKAAKKLADETRAEHRDCTYDLCDWCRLADDVHDALKEIW